MLCLGSIHHTIPCNAHRIWISTRRVTKRILVTRSLWNPVFTSLERQSEISKISHWGTQHLPLHFPYFSLTLLHLFDAHTHRAIRVLNSADVILSEDTRHSGKLLHHYNIKTPLVSLIQSQSQSQRVIPICLF